MNHESRIVLARLNVGSYTVSKFTYGFPIHLNLFFGLLLLIRAWSTTICLLPPSMTSPVYYITNTSSSNRRVQSPIPGAYWRWKPRSARGSHSKIQRPRAAAVVATSLETLGAKTKAIRVRRRRRVLSCGIALPPRVFFSH